MSAAAPCRQAHKGVQHPEHQWKHQDQAGMVHALDCDGQPVPPPMTDAAANAACGCSDPLCGCSMKPGWGPYAGPTFNTSDLLGYRDDGHDDGQD